MKKILYMFAFVGILSFVGGASAVHADTVFNADPSYELSDIEIIQLQQFLFIEGYLDSFIVDDMSDDTLNAVLEFQKDNDLEESGYFDEATIDAINEKMNDTLSYTPTEAEVRSANTASVIDAF